MTNRSMTPRQMEACRGVTLVELLAALLISAFIMVMASRIFLTGNHQFLERSSESRGLEESYRMKTFLQGALRREVERCSAGKLWLRGSEGGKDVETLLKAHFPNLTGAEFHCLEPAADASSLVEWKDWFQPRLIEYQVMMKRDGKTDTLRGSWME